jgi:hypothetical protein
MPTDDDANEAARRNGYPGYNSERTSSGVGAFMKNLFEAGKLLLPDTPSTFLFPGH